MENTTNILKIVALCQVIVLLAFILWGYAFDNYWYSFCAWLRQIKGKWNKPAPWSPKPVMPKKPHEEFTELLDSIVTHLDNKRRVLVVVPTMDLLYFTQGFVMQRNSSYIPALYHSGTSPGQRREALREALLIIGALQTLSQGCDLSGFDELIFVGCGDGKMCQLLKDSYYERKALRNREN
jgi:hypothetical protein